MIQRDGSKIEINDDTIKKTTKCEKGFSCIASHGKGICKVDLYVADGLLFIKCEEPSICNYKKFESSSICNCPTREEIFKKYKI